MKKFLEILASIVVLIFVVKYAFKLVGQGLGLLITLVVLALLITLYRHLQK